jgi:cytoskeletal protein CcmA (bactofilin family)
VNGNINCARLVLQDGACFNGKVMMQKQSPLKIAPKPETLGDSYTDSGKNKSA